MWENVYFFFLLWKQRFSSSEAQDPTNFWFFEAVDLPALTSQCLSNFQRRFGFVANRTTWKKCLKVEFCKIKIKNILKDFCRAPGKRGPWVSGEDRGGWTSVQEEERKSLWAQSAVSNSGLFGTNSRKIQQGFPKKYLLFLCNTQPPPLLPHPPPPDCTLLWQRCWSTTAVGDVHRTAKKKINSWYRSTTLKYKTPRVLSSKSETQHLG